MPSANTKLKHLTGNLCTSDLSKILSPAVPLSASDLHHALSLRSREIYDHSGSKQRDERRSARLKKQHALQKHKSSKLKPKPLSAKERRKLCLDEIPKEERKWELYASLRTLWVGYMREIMGLKSSSDINGGFTNTQPYISPQNAGPILASADMHGAVVQCVRSRCVTRVGVKGVVVQDRKFVFVVITEKNEMKMLPKEHSIFRIEIPIAGHEAEMVAPSTNPVVNGKVVDKKNLVFEIHGEQFQNRAPDRAKKQFKQHYNPDL